MESLAGKAVVITGASSGIGEAIAVALGGQGAKLTLTARRAERLEAVAAAVREAGGEALVAPADARDEAALLGVFEAHDEAWGRLDVLVNNAGLGRSASLHDGATENWRLMLDINVMALCIASREALARFPESGGHVLNISSIAAYKVTRSGGFYAGTKHMVRALTEGLRAELRGRESPSRVSAISPGFVQTEFLGQFMGGDHAKAQEFYETKFAQVLRPQDIAAIALQVLQAPRHVEVHDILVRPTDQEG